MSIQDQFTSWLRNMGYNDEIPDNLNNICNPSTSSIFTQIMKLQPKKEVEDVRTNIIVNRMKNSESSVENNSLHPLKEIEIYKKKKDLEKKIKHLKRSIEHDNRKINEISHENNIKYIKTDRLKQQIDDCEEKTYLLEKKVEKLESDIKYVKDLVVLTPVEENETSPDKITETLQICAEKLEKLYVINSNKSFCATSGILKPSIRHDGYFSNIQNSTTITLNHEWFQESNKENTVMNFCPSSCKKMPKSCTKSKGRESLGLLPEGCLDSTNKNDFLITTITQQQQSSAVAARASLFFDESSNLIDFDSNIPSSSMLKDLETSFFERISDNKEVGEILRELLHKNNRGVIFKIWKNLGEEFNDRLNDLLLEFSKIDSKCEEPKEVDKISLYAKHVKNELEIIKIKKLNNKLHQCIQDKKNKLYNKLIDDQTVTVNPDEISKIIDLQLEECRVDSRINFLQKEKNVLVLNTTNTDNLEELNKKIESINSKIKLKLNSINDVITSISKIFELLKNTREETVTYVARLDQFCSDRYWMQPLINCYFQKEIEIFKRYPSLQFNKKCLGDFECSYLDLHHTQIPLYIELNSSILNNLALLLETPFKTTENIILDRIKLKLKILTYKNLLASEKPTKVDLKIVKKSLKELVEKGEFAANIINRLKRIECTSSGKIVTLSDNIRKNFDLWIETDFGDYLLPDRKYEGHDFRYYWKQINKY